MQRVGDGWARRGDEEDFEALSKRATIMARRQTGNHPQVSPELYLGSRAAADVHR